MTQLYDADAVFKRSDAAGAIEALQITVGNLDFDHPYLDDLDYINEVVLQDMWDAAKSNNIVNVGICLGFLTCWAEDKQVDTASLEMRMKDVRDSIT